MTPISIAWNRFGLGGRPQDQQPDNPERWLLDQFERYDPRPAAIASQPNSTEAIQSYLGIRTIRRMARESGAEDRGQQQIREVRQTARRNYVQAVAARGAQAVESDAPFAERMVYFWSNHFAVSVQKNQLRGMAGAHEFEAIRPHVLGSFRDMLRAAVLHPAMFIYLDQFQSTGPNSQIAVRRRRRGRNEAGLNENLAREILELHTLGAQGGYTQADVTEFARAMTGWTVDGTARARRAATLPNGSAWAGYMHEPGSRTVLGQTYTQDGHEQSLAILDTVAKHPSTAKHVATKLVRHFAGDEPPQPMIARLERTFLESNGDLPSLYRAIVESPEAWTEQPVKFRTPWEWSIAIMRATGGSRMNARRFVRMQQELGQVPWGPPSPQGYPDTSSNWAAPDALIRRVEVAAQIAALSREGDIPSLARHLFQDGLNDSTATWISRAESPEQGLALLLSSPEMMRR
ncbi:DUF1800 domain-containing protein [Pontixanthobacter aestiaquae]|uniref:DUF1800 family protein n=1 Tax=Pontixanthobacter aestiaquae TaxID=1509367 RepID=A0A844Z7K0_9SPHN|nr:DUF1800 domain-containing protein [Pontixanthobacter aestiaquae]MDN3645779.1 DUF1800 domain-containing protein [Pontixanthobacter aestiaquae]MXO83226.1 DUF1800 family protein [Pontixanthobacter aestiaquae]